MRFSAFATTMVMSPWPFLVFLVIPLIIIVQRAAGLSFLDPVVLFANNILFLLYVSVRLASYLKRFSRDIRYGERRYLRGRRIDLQSDGDRVRKDLSELGYVFNSAGTYGERRDRGYLGSILIHAGLVMALTVGIYDNYRQFSGALVTGVGKPVPLSDRESYTARSAGILSFPDAIPLRLQLTKQHFASQEWPRGAAAVVISSKNGRDIRTGVVAPGRPLEAKGFEIHMVGYFFHTWLIITTVNDHLVYSDWVKLVPLKDKADDYTHSGIISNDFMKIEGIAHFDPIRNRLKIAVTRAGEDILEVVLGMGLEDRKTQGDYRAKLEGIGKWSEFHVVRKRHKGLLLAGAVILVAGSLLRLLFRPRRVWITSSNEGCNVRSTDRAALRAVSAAGEDRDHETEGRH